MEWETELLSTAKKAPPRKGRRAGLTLTNSREDDKSSLDRLENSTREPQAGTSWHAPHEPMPPPRARRAGGWANEDIKSSKKKGTSSSISGLLDRQRFKSPDRTKPAFDSDDDIPFIPDLDDLGDEDFKPPINYAASVAMNRVATYKELDAAGPPYLKLDGMDLSLLAKCLDIEDDQNVDEDKVLTWDMLFTDVASRLHNEAECKDKISNTDG